MRRTALASVMFALLSYGAAHWLTHDFQVWTSEGARRLEIVLDPLAAPFVVVEGPGLPRPTPLAQLLSNEGAVTIIDFMYTRCVTVCAALGSTFQQMQSVIAQSAPGPGAAPLRLLSISFDPEHDDTGVLAAYSAGRHADPAIWRFARVAQPAGKADARRLLDHYQVTVIPDGIGGFEHNAALLVADPTGRLVHVFDYAELDTALRFARSLATRSGVQ